MPNKIFLQKLGFTPKDNASGIFYKNYQTTGNYCIEIDIEEKRFNFGNKIKSESGTTLNFSQEENWVVFECVNRLLEKGYKPKDITLEKIYPTGHGTSGRLDILVKKNNRAYLMIECKIWGQEFDKAFKKLQKDGGQLFTYFQQDRDVEYLMLYASNFDGKEINFKNEIIKIEEHYREAGNVKDFYDRWNKLAKQNGIFDDWINAYEFQSKALTRKDLKIIKQEDSSFIFNRFLEILRHNVVSDKPNAFNKIFTLFLCKIIDEDRAKDEQLHFQWLEGEDDNISFQKRLTDLYKRGMNELLEKEVTDMGDQEFEQKFGSVDEKYKTEFLKILTEIRLKKNNEFAFKEVFDDPSFEENAKVVKEVVELLQGYQLRYNRKHQYLGDFFELLLATGLKQESGQFFTPVPVAKYIIKSLPIKEIIDEKISKGNPNDLLPFIIDYAAGSGHFLTESMGEVQNTVDKIDENKLNPNSAKKIKSWKDDQYGWAFEYIYGVEKDYRLVKTAKVSCYLHGDGLAKVIHGDGLGTFDQTPEYRGKLKDFDKCFPQDNKQFDIVISNPPYAVSSFKGTLNEENASKSFDLFSRLTDQSSEIECLFIERTKQLLKDGGVAGIILPSSILSNTGIYTRAREILLKYFEIVAITELGSGTFMATGTNTTILFLRRRTNYEWENIKNSVENFFSNYKDITVNRIENIFSKYVRHVWDKISFEDYISLLQNRPNERIRAHDIYNEYEKEIKNKNNDDKQKIILEIEKEKLIYFILAYPQKVVIVKSGKKKEEKSFLGYEFSNRRGYEGIHAIQRSKSIDECTKMFDPIDQENPEKASSYIYKAFIGEQGLEATDPMKKHVFFANLIDMMAFDRIYFEKTISLGIKKKVKFEEFWKTEKIVFLSDIAGIQKGTSITQEEVIEGNIPVIAGGQYPAYFHNKANRNGNIITVSASGAYSGFANYFEKQIFASDCNTIQSKDEKIITTKLIFVFLKNIQKEIYHLQRGQAQPHVYAEDLAKIKIPLPSKEIQEKILRELKKLEEKEEKIINALGEDRKEIEKRATALYSKERRVKISSVCNEPVYGANEKAVTGNRKMDYRYIRITDIDNNGNLKDDWVTAEKIEKKYILQNGDFLFARSGATAGKVFLYDEKIGKAIYAGYLIRFRTNREILIPYFLNFVLQSGIYKNWVLQKRQGTAQPNINAQQYRSFEIPLPNLNEQQKIVAQIKKIENQISKLNEELQEIKDQKAEVLKKYL